MVDTTDPIAWVSIIPEAEATGALAAAYDSVRGADGRVENLYLAMSLTPAAIVPADAHYLALLHNPDNPLDRWLAELMGTFVAILCGSDYAALNHGANFRMFLANDSQADRWLDALRQGTWHEVLTGPVLAAARYTYKLTMTPAEMSEADIAALREARFSDKAISYLIQIVAAFSYWARMINGLGTRLGPTVGLMGTAAPGR